MSEQGEREQELLGHLSYHKTKEYLLRMCHDEEARTIREALERTPKRRLDYALAWVLSKDT